MEKITGINIKHLLFASGMEFDYDLYKALVFLKRRNIDGIIVSYEITKKFDNIDLNDLDLPIITINQNISDSIISVMPNDFKGGYDAASHLIQKGITNPSVISGPKDRVSSIERLNGFRQGFKDFDIVRIPIKYGKYNFDTGFNCARELLAEDSNIDVIFCLNDFIAAGAIDYARRNNFDVPEQIKVIGYDDRDFSAFWPTPITTFS